MVAETCMRSFICQHALSILFGHISYKIHCFDIYEPRSVFGGYLGKFDAKLTKMSWFVVELYSKSKLKIGPAVKSWIVLVEIFHF